MKDRSIIHSTFEIVRTYPVPAARVFAAFASREAKVRWFHGPDGWDRTDHELDFRVGGREHLSGGPPEGPQRVFDAIFQDIVPNERIITTYEMHLGSERISVSLATIELQADGGSTTLIYTEQGAFLDGLDLPGQRLRGTEELLDKLGASLAASVG